MNSKKNEVLLLDPDIPILQPLVEGLRTKGWLVHTTNNVNEGIAIIENDPPPYGIFSLRFKEGTVLDLLETLKRKRQDARVIILTMYGDIPTAVAAMKLGATDFLLKPVFVEDVAATLLSDSRSDETEVVDPETVRMEYIRQLYRLSGDNVSGTARLLGNHRRSMQRQIRRAIKPE